MLAFFYVDAFNLYFGSCRGTPYNGFFKLTPPSIGTFARRHWQKANFHPPCRTARARSRSQRPGDRSMWAGGAVWARSVGFP